MSTFLGLFLKGKNKFTRFQFVGTSLNSRAFATNSFEFGLNSDEYCSSFFAYIFVNRFLISRYKHELEH